MNIETNPKITSTTLTSSTTSKPKPEEGTTFAEELNKGAGEVTGAANKEIIEDADVKKETDEKLKEEKNKEVSPETKNEVSQVEEAEEKPESVKNDDIDSVIGGLQEIVEEINKVNRPEEKHPLPIKDNNYPADKDNNKEDNGLINNDMNIQEPKEQLTPQMNANMNFNSDGQPFAAFVNQEQQQKLQVTETELAEEKAILSTMSENIAIANKNIALAKNQIEKPDLEVQKQEITPQVKTVSDEQGVKKVDTKTNITVETVVKFDSVVVNKADADFFIQLVETGTAEVNTPQTAKSSQVSKALADLVAKSMKDNQPVRIDFDNNISVIIKVGKDGKISADFLPSSQVAEAYLKENLPLLKQRFDDNNIEYDELNQRRQKQDEKNNRKKGSKDE